MRLSDLKTGESATILKVLGHGGFRRRIMEMGVVRGQRIEVVFNAPLKDPIDYKIMGYDLSLRRSEARMIVVISDAEAQQLIDKYPAAEPRLRRVFDRTESSRPQQRPERDADTAEEHYASIDEVVGHKSRTITVALVGNPNSGKTSLFNALSGSHEHVGNYSGVTVGAKSGHLDYKGYRLEITDLPGTYALSAYTPEERFVRTHIAENTPDVIINAVVASNLERNLYLTTELIDINPCMVVSLNMFDELESSGAKLDYEQLGRMLGVPMVPVEARNRKGIETLLDTVIAVYENRDARVRHIHIPMGQMIEEAMRRLGSEVSLCRDELPQAFPPRYFTMKLLEGDRQIEAMLENRSAYPSWIALRDKEVRRISEALGEDVETAVTNQKYGFIQGALKETFTPSTQEEASRTALIDAFVTHKFWGFPIFFLLMWLMFWCTFSLGGYPQRWIGSLVGLIGAGIDALMPAGALHDLLIDGVVGGVGAVIVFLPNIMILYLCISFMEDSGYLARAAFIMDRIMHRIGLHGKSFIPLIMGFGCNVPAIMASRTIESRSSRIITVLITPFMSCSARIPIYLLLVGTFFAPHATMVMIGLYILGIVVAVLTARLMRRFFFPVDETPFVMELPPYRMPSGKTTLRHMWEKCAQYLRKMGGMILIASIVVWFLSYYPRGNAGESATAHYENSYLGQLGHGTAPVFKPLGLNWKASVALLSGVPAKEIVVSTLGVLYADDAVDPTQADSLHNGEYAVSDAGGSQNLAQVAPISAARVSATDQKPTQTATLSQRLEASGDFTQASALAFLVFILLYFPCIATIVAIRSEIGWRWALASVVYSCALAWAVAWVFYRIALL